MKKAHKKGQGALEYLMTYGWALLIIVVVGAALYALGVFTPQTTSNCSGFDYFQFQSQKLNLTEYKIVLLNGNTDVEVTDVSVGGTSLTVAYNNISAGKKDTVTGFDWTGGGKSVGDTFDYEVIIYYDTTDISGMTDRATCTGTIQ